MNRVLVVGGGIAGLGAARRLARAGRRVLVAEAKATPGGNACSIDLDGISIDPAFGIFGGPTYPNFIRLLDEIGVAYRPLAPFDEYVARYHDGDHADGGAPSWNTVAQIPYARHVVAEMLRFVEQHAPRIMATEDPNTSAGEYFARHGFSKEFAAYAYLGGFIVGYGGHPAQEYLDYPLRDFLEASFFRGTGAPLLRLTHGAGRYITRLVETLHATGLVEVRCAAPVVVTARDDQGVTASVGGVIERFDTMVMTAAPHLALAALGDQATDDERRTLGAFTFTNDRIHAHRDTSILPRVRSEKSFAFLQLPRPHELDKPDWYAVATRRWSDNDGSGADGYLTHDYRATGRIAPKGGRELTIPHVRYDFRIMALRARVAALQGRRCTWFAGGHLRGWMRHEDALVSGYLAADAISGASTEPILLRDELRSTPVDAAPLPLPAIAATLARFGDDALFTWLDDHGEPVDRLTGRDLDRRSANVARELVARGVQPGDRAMLAYPPGLEFIVGLLGCMRAGVVAVPAYPPPPPGSPGMDAFLATARDCAASIALTSAAWRPLSLLAGLRATVGALARGRVDLSMLRWIVTDRLDDGPSFEDVDRAADDVAILQYTSGSTSTPRGVMITHGNLRHQLDTVVGRGVGVTPRSIGVWWVPQYHDLGLISGILASLYVGAKAFIASPLSFLKDPSMWMRSASRFGATHTAAPDFAFALAVRARDVHSQRLDLSAMRVVMSAGEPVRAAHADAFLAAFEGAGLRRSAFFPAYGLAEHTVGVSLGGKKALHVDMDALGRGRVEAGGHAVVGCGLPALGVEVRVVDPKTCVPCGPDEVGELWVDSPSRASGYWGKPVDSDATFRARLAGEAEGRWLRTGDQGFVRDGEVFVTGRLKDLVIVRGRNVYPADVEATVERVEPAVKRGRVAAFGTRRTGEESLVVAAELRDARADDLQNRGREVARAVIEAHHVAPHEIVFVAPGGVPKTTSGKLRRGRARELWEKGELRVVARWTQGAEDRLEPTDIVDSLDRSTLGRLTRLVYERTRLRVGADASIEQLGTLDSLALVELLVAIQHEFGLPPDWIGDVGGSSLTEIAAQIEALSARTAGAASAASAASAAGAAPGAMVRIRGGDERAPRAPAPAFVFGPLFLATSAARALSAHLDGRRAVYTPSDASTPHDAVAFARLAAAEVAEIAGKGPAILIGYSFGAVVAHLVARVLEERVLEGREAAGRTRVFLLDPQMPGETASLVTGRPTLDDVSRWFSAAVEAEGASASASDEATLDAYRRLVDPSASEASLRAYLEQRVEALASLHGAAAKELGARRSTSGAVLFRATLPAPQSVDGWLPLYARSAVVDVARTHFRMLDAAAHIGRTIESHAADIDRLDRLEPVAPGVPGVSA